MEPVQTCPECGALRTESATCQDHFYQMLYWEAEYPAYGAEVHHLMVLCYHLQHPTLYSQDGLRCSMRLLVDFVEHGITPQEVRQHSHAEVDSGKRDWKVKGTPADYGAYVHPPQWTMRAADVTADNVHRYCDNVRAWAQSVYDALKASGDLQR